MKNIHYHTGFSSVLLIILCDNHSYLGESLDILWKLWNDKIPVHGWAKKNK